MNDKNWGINVYDCTDNLIAKDHKMNEFYNSI